MNTQYLKPLGIHSKDITKYPPLLSANFYLKHVFIFLAYYKILVYPIIGKIIKEEGITICVKYYYQ